MHLHRQIKMDARRAMTNNWGKALAIVFLMISVYLLFAIVETLVSMLLGIQGAFGYEALLSLFADLPDTSIMVVALTGVMSVGSFLVMIPLNLGITRWYYHLTDCQSEDILSIFFCFSTKKMFLRSLWLRILVVVRMALWAVVLYLLPCGLGVVGYWLMQRSSTKLETLTVVLCFLGAVVLFTIATIFFFIILNGYTLTKYYILDGKTTARQSIKQSLKAMKGFKTDLFLFYLSFFFWVLSCVAVVPLLYVVPYFSTSKALFARYLMERAEYRKGQEQSTQEYHEPLGHNTEQEKAQMNVRSTQTYTPPDLRTESSF